MDDSRSDANAISPVSVGETNRRRVLGGLVGGTLAGLVGWLEIEAKNKRRAKRSNKSRKQGRDQSGDQRGDKRKGASKGSAKSLKVLTRNLYLGADLAPTFGVGSFPDLVEAVTGVYDMVQATNFPERAKALADEIAAFHPHVVGLQEVTLWRSESPSNLSLTPNATKVEYDFRDILLSELAARGKSYAEVITATNLDAEAPRGIFPTDLHDVRITDRDMILVRTDLPENVFKVTNKQQGNFEARTEIPILNAKIPVPRGWNAVDVTLQGRTVQVVNTHLEPFDLDTRVAQAKQLLAVIDELNSGSPTVLLGDLNSAAPIGETYGLILGAEFVDAWTSKRGDDDGFTWGHAEDLRNPAPMLTERIDYVLTRGGITASSVNRVGHELEDRTPSGLWPSDHVGVWAVLHLEDE
jgi:endonuclease/exonuclease/phosphatase family metal-dependent hydrolase